TLRPKLIAAFACMAAMAGCSGAVGLLYVDRIGTNVAVFSDVTSPLLGESMALVENARRLRSIFLRAIATGENTEELARQVDELHATSLRHLQERRRLAEAARIDVQAEVAQQLEQEFVRTLRDMLVSYRREQAASRAAMERHADFQAQRKQVRTLLAELSDRLEGRLAKTEDEAKVQVQTGSTTIDELGELLSTILTEIYPALQSSQKLMRSLEYLDDVIEASPAQMGAAELAASEQRATTAFKTIRAGLMKL